jgi:hypothetical protein
LGDWKLAYKIRRVDNLRLNITSRRTCGLQKKKKKKIGPPTFPNKETLMIGRE